MSGPSRTSQAVAMVRAGLDRPASPHGDVAAQSKLCAGMQPAPIPHMLAHLTARTRFVDDQVSAAIERGVRQAVVLGAGYDDRALRFRTPGVRFYELDHPGTQADKRARLLGITAEGGPVLAAVDFAHDDAGEVLAAAGHDAAAASLFICEGLLVYLDAATIVELLTALRSRATSDSRLVASLATHPDGMSSPAVVAELNATRRGAATEPWRTILAAAAHCDLLRDAGWDPVVAADDHLLEPTAPAGRSLLVAADPVYWSHERA
jgi:methyltransferase (TIGR00027 family)